MYAVNTGGLSFFQELRERLKPRYSYLDPITYQRVELSHLASGKSDMVNVERDHDEYPVRTNFAVFHDREETPVLPDLTGPLPNPRPAVITIGRSNVVLAGYRALLGRDRLYNFDEAFTEQHYTDRQIRNLGSPHQYQNELIGFRNTSETGIYTLKRISADNVISILDPVVFLGANESPNFGSFLYRILPKVVQVRQLQKNLRILVPLYFPAAIQLLTMAGVEADRIIPQDVYKRYSLRRVIVPSIRNRDVWLDDQTLKLYDSLRNTYGGAKQNRRLYISRRDAKGQPRVMTNEDELLHHLADRQFEIVEPQKLDARTQIKLFSSASFILSQSGSALYNTVFCRPGTRLIDIESEPHWVAGHSRLFASRGLRYGIFEGRPKTYNFNIHHQPFSVDIPRLLKRVDEFLEYDR